MPKINPAEQFWLFLLVNLGGTLLILGLLYAFTLRPYKNHQLRKYGFRLTGAPAKFGIGCYLAYIFFSSIGLSQGDLQWMEFLLSVKLSWLWLFQEPATAWEFIRLMLVVGAPAVGLATVIGIVKIRNPVIVAVNIPVLYIYCLICSYFIIFAFVIYLMGAFLAGALFTGSGIGNSRKPGGGYVCPYCGASISEGVVCPCGRSQGGYGYNTPRAADDFSKPAVYE